MLCRPVKIFVRRHYIYTYTHVSLQTRFHLSGILPVGRAGQRLHRIESRTTTVPTSSRQSVSGSPVRTRVQIRGVQYSVLSTQFSRNDSPLYTRLVFSFTSNAAPLCTHACHCHRSCPAICTLQPLLCPPAALKPLKLTSVLPHANRPQSPPPAVLDLSFHLASIATSLSPIHLSSLYISITLESRHTTVNLPLRACHRRVALRLLSAPRLYGILSYVVRDDLSTRSPSPSAGRCAVQDQRGPASSCHRTSSPEDPADLLVSL